jgi:NAD(P)H dehydrogenase (quinone)
MDDPLRLAVRDVGPLWWYSMPAILKGWDDRVYAYGFAYGVGEHSATASGKEPSQASEPC